MSLSSKYESNLKFQNTKIVLGTIVLGEEHSTLSHDDLIVKASALIKKAKIKSDVKYTISSEQIDEYGNMELVMKVWYERLETNEEYNKRIEKLQIDDLQNFYKSLATFNYLKGECSYLKEIFDKFGKTKSTPPSWMKEMLKEFFDNKG